jgi:hypothetical protein
MQRLRASTVTVSNEHACDQATLATPGDEWLWWAIAMFNRDPTNVPSLEVTLYASVLGLPCPLRPQRVRLTPPYPDTTPGHEVPLAPGYTESLL